MKKVFLYLLLPLSLFCGTVAIGQSFTVANDTVFANVGGTATVQNPITNTYTSPITVKWRVDTTDAPADWLAPAAFGICDNYTCRSNDNDMWLYNDTTHFGTQFTSSNYAPGVPGNFSLSLNYSSVSLGTHYFVITLGSGTFTKKTVFVINKVPVAMPTVPTGVSEVVLYPNPAHDELNVVYDANSDVKNIAIYNVIGKVMMVYKVSGSSANLNLENIPGGIYFVRLYNSSGNIMATKKFTKQ